MRIIRGEVCILMLNPSIAIKIWIWKGKNENIENEEWFLTCILRLTSGTVYKHLLKSWCKKGVLESLDPCKGGLENIEFTCLSMGSPIICMAKRGPWNFVRSERGALKNFQEFFFLNHTNTPHPLMNSPSAWIGLYYSFQKCVWSPGLKGKGRLSKNIVLQNLVLPVSCNTIPAC